MSNRTRVALAAVAAVAALAAFVGVSRSQAQTTPPCDSSVVAMLNAGLDTEAPPPESYSMVPIAVENAAYFMQYRSGVVLSEETKQRLVELEQATMPGWSNGETRLTRAEVKDVITASFMTQLASVTDAQIDAMASNSLRVLPGFRPENADPIVQLRSNGDGVGDPAVFCQKAREFRDGSTAEALTYRAAAKTGIAQEVDQQCDILGYACPNRWNVNYYSPYRVFMLAYALATDDHLGGSYTDIHNQMESVESSLYRDFGVVNPCAGRTPFGQAGYVYSSPTNVVFNGTAQMRLLDRIDALH